MKEGGVREEGVGRMEEERRKRAEGRVAGAAV